MKQCLDGSEEMNTMERDYDDENKKKIKKRTKSFGSLFYTQGVQSNGIEFMCKMRSSEENKMPKQQTNTFVQSLC